MLPVFLKALPLKRDFAESKPVVSSAAFCALLALSLRADLWNSQMAALISLIRAENPIALQHFDHILGLFHQALASVAEGVYPELEGAQLDEETKEHVLALLKDLNGSIADKLAAAGLASYVA